MKKKLVYLLTLMFALGASSYSFADEEDTTAAKPADHKSKDHPSKDHKSKDHPSKDQKSKAKPHKEHGGT